MRLKKPLEWTLSKIPEKDMPWASSYLRNKLNEQQQRTGQNHPLTNASTPKEFLVQAIKLCNADDFRDPGWLANTDKQMKQAWLQRKRRTGASGDKPYSFFMNKQVQTRLHQLAAMTGTSINKTLEQLILDTSGVARGLQEKHRIEVGLLKQRHQEELERLKENAARKRAKQLSQNTDLNNGQQADSKQAKSPQAGVTLTTEELHELIATMVDRKISEIGGIRTDSLNTPPHDDDLGAGDQTPPAPTCEDKQEEQLTDVSSEAGIDTDIEASSSDTKPLSSFGQKLQKAMEG